MKHLIVLLFVFAAVQSEARDDDQYQDAAQAKFNQMSPEEALDSNFKKQYWNIHMPGSSTWFRPTGLCTDGSTVQTIKPFSKCVKWSAYDSEDGKTKVFSNKGDADDYGSRVTCVEKTSPQILSTPINYAVKQCVMWEYRNSDGDKVTTTSTRLKNKHDLNNSDCVQFSMVAKTMPTTFEVSFYRNKIENDKFLGKYRYALSVCQGGQVLPPVYAN